MNAEDIRRLFEHMWWADERVLQALETASAPPARAVGLYAHLLAAERVWIERVMGTNVTVTIWPEADLSACRRQAQETHDKYKAFLETVSSARLAQVVHYTSSAGEAFETRTDDILLQVALHGAYHRGQIALLLRDAGEEPAPTDYIVFARGVPAAGGAR